MTFDFIDVQWVVICEALPSRVFESVCGQVNRLKWECSGDLASEDIDSRCGPLQDSVLGSARYRKCDNRSPERSLFWSVSHSGLATRVTGGLYLKEFDDGNSQCLPALDCALRDMIDMFDFDSARCVVLTLEEDDGVELSPVLVGAYRPALWSKVSAAVEGCDDLFDVVERGEWTVVRPVNRRKDAEVVLNISSMPERLSDALHQVHQHVSDALSFRS